MFIYKIINTVNGKIYIGQTVHPINKRWIQHKSDSKRNKDHALHRAIRKYGSGNFIISTISRCSSLEEMNYRESYYIKLFNSLAPIGYNLGLGGNNKRLHEETKQKISKAHLGKKCGPAWNKGIPHSEETKRKLSITSGGSNNGMFGKTHSVEARANISKAQTGRKKSQKEILAIIKAHVVSVICHQNGRIFSSVKDAAYFCGITPQSVTQVAKGQRKQCKGYTFAYL